MIKFEQGVCVVLPTLNKDREVLAISRRNSTTQFGLPGGKVERFESNLDAVIRETDEECKLRLRPHLLIPLFVGACFGADGRHYWVTTYLYEGGFDSAPEAGEEDFILNPMLMDDLCKKEISPFAHYNQQVLGAWNRYDLK